MIIFIPHQPKPFIPPKDSSSCICICQNHTSYSIIYTLKPLFHGLLTMFVGFDSSFLAILEIITLITVKPVNDQCCTDGTINVVCVWRWYRQTTLIHCGQVIHIWVSKLTIIVSDNGLSPDRRQASNWTNAGILSIAPLRTNFTEILIESHAFSFKKMHLKKSSANLI